MSSLSPPSSSYPWPDDPLSSYLRMSEENTFISSTDLAERYRRLVQIHQLWLKAAQTLEVMPNDELLAVWFLNQSNSAWLAAVRVGMGGQPVEAQPLLRSALEYAGYALHFTRNSSLREVWIRRHDSSEARSASRTSFSMAEVKRALAAESEKLARDFNGLYEQTIDFGSHPNERALSIRLNLRTEGTTEISSVTQLTDQPRDYLFLAATASRVGVLCLSIFDRVFRTKFRLASLDVEIDRMRQNA